MRSFGWWHIKKFLLMLGGFYWYERRTSQPACKPIGQPASHSTNQPANHLARVSLSLWILDKLNRFKDAKLRLVFLALDWACLGKFKDANLFRVFNKLLANNKWVESRNFYFLCKDTSLRVTLVKKLVIFLSEQLFAEGFEGFNK